MAKLGEPVHPNVMAAVMAPRARELCENREAARERQAMIQRMKGDGVSVPDIARSLGVCTNRVYQILRRLQAYRKSAQ